MVPSLVPIQRDVKPKARKPEADKEKLKRVVEEEPDELDDGEEEPAEMEKPPEPVKRLKLMPLAPLSGLGMGDEDGEYGRMDVDEDDFPTGR